MAAQTIVVTAAAPTPAAITLAADASCLHVSGNWGSGSRAIVELYASDDGTAYVPLAVGRDAGQPGLRTGGVYSLTLKAGWRLKAVISNPNDCAGASVRVAVE